MDDENAVRGDRVAWKNVYEPENHRNQAVTEDIRALTAGF